MSVLINVLMNVFFGYQQNLMKIFKFFLIAFIYFQFYFFNLSIVYSQQMEDGKSGASGNTGFISQLEKAVDHYISFLKEEGSQSQDKLRERPAFNEKKSRALHSLLYLRFLIWCIEREKSQYGNMDIKGPSQKEFSTDQKKYLFELRSKQIDPFLQSFLKLGSFLNITEYQMDTIIAVGILLQKDEISANATDDSKNYSDRFYSRTNFLDFLRFPITLSAVEVNRDSQLIVTMKNVPNEWGRSALSGIVEIGKKVKFSPCLVFSKYLLNADPVPPRYSSDFFSGRLTANDFSYNLYSLKGSSHSRPLDVTGIVSAERSDGGYEEQDFRSIFKGLNDAVSARETKTISLLSNNSLTLNLDLFNSRLTLILDPFGKWFLVPDFDSYSHSDVFKRISFHLLGKYFEKVKSFLKLKTRGVEKGNEERIRISDTDTESTESKERLVVPVEMIVEAQHLYPQPIKPLVKISIYKAEITSLNYRRLFNDSGTQIKIDVNSLYGGGGPFNHTWIYYNEGLYKVEDVIMPLSTLSELLSGDKINYKEVKEKLSFVLEFIRGRNASSPMSERLILSYSDFLKNDSNGFVAVLSKNASYDMLFYLEKERHEEKEEKPTKREHVAEIQKTLIELLQKGFMVSSHSQRDYKGTPIVHVSVKEPDFNGNVRDFLYSKRIIDIDLLVTPPSLLEEEGKKAQNKRVLLPYLDHLIRVMGTEKLELFDKFSDLILMNPWQQKKMPVKFLTSEGGKNQTVDFSLDHILLIPSGDLIIEEIKAMNYFKNVVKQVRSNFPEQEGMILFFKIRGNEQLEKAREILFGNVADRYRHQVNYPRTIDSLFEDFFMFVNANKEVFIGQERRKKPNQICDFEFLPLGKISDLQKLLLTFVLKEVRSSKFVEGEEGRRLLLLDEKEFSKRKFNAIWGFERMLGSHFNPNSSPDFITSCANILLMYF